MKATGNSRIVFSLTILRPSRCCRLAKIARPSSESVAILVLGRDEHDKLAVDRRAGGQRARQRLKIGIGVGNQLLAARP